MSDVVLTITLVPETGFVNISGPIKNKVLSYGMLESAKDALRDFHEQAVAQQQAKVVQPVRLELPPGFNAS